MRLVDILLLALVTALVLAAVCAMRRRKKRGRHISCGGDCTHCAMGCAQKERQQSD
ncbi:MAG: FeoB-associated Cys-rich membrane protein [Oscillospiraceae bacterium]|nr:FeoB-associated Cys-rich membrane protein [Clostridiales bacterium]MDY6095336.1 FeoB-associated Cys-rich membrane protein [Oscillospiraceae bacterium]